MSNKEKLDLDNIKIEDLTEYLSLTNYLKDYSREEIETFYHKKRKALDDAQYVKACERTNYRNAIFEIDLKYFYDLGFGQGTSIKRASMYKFSLGTNIELFTDRKIILTGKVYKRYNSDRYDVMFECYDEILGESLTSLTIFDKSLTFVKEYTIKRSTKTFEEVLSSLDDKNYLYM